MKSASIESVEIPVEEWPIDSSWKGDSIARITVSSQSADRCVTSGMWSVEPGDFEFTFPWDEFIHVIDGEAEVTDVDSGTTIQIRSGHIAHFKLGTKTYWNVTKKIRKYYVIRTPEPYGS